MVARVRFVTVFVLLLSMFGCAGSTQPKPDWEAAADVDIPAFSTFDWVDITGGRPLAILDSRIHDALRAQLVEKGFAESSEAPDFLVSYETVEYETTQRSNPVSIGLGVGTWGGNVGGSVGTSVGVGGKEGVLQQNRLTIRAVDPRTSREVWIGTTVFEEPADAQVVDRAIAGVMQGFPGKRN